MKDHPIIIGIDDAAFDLRANSEKTQLIGVVCQGTRMVNVVQTQIQIDGNDATEKLMDLLKQNEEHVQYIITHTITFGGFNLINLNRIFSVLNKPIIAINERKVDIEAVLKALKKRFPDSHEKKILDIVDSGNLYQTEVETAGGRSKIFYHAKGIEPKEVDLLLTKICIDSKLPECLRLAHLIGTLF